jgi:hypothetical protein
MAARARKQAEQAKHSTQGQPQQAAAEVAVEVEKLLQGLVLPKSKGTKPLLLTKPTLRRLLKAIAKGMPLSGACTVAGITTTTLAEWRNEFPQIEELVELAREQLREKLLERIEVASADDWRASDAMLKLAYAQDYRKAQQQTNQHLHLHGDTHVTLSIEKQAELREQRRRILASTKGAHVLAGIPAGNESKPEQEQEPAQTYHIPRQSLWVQDAQVLPEASEAINHEQPESLQEQPAEPASDAINHAEQPEQQQPSNWTKGWYEAADKPKERTERDEANEAWLRLLR